MAPISLAQNVLKSLYAAALALRLAALPEIVVDMPLRVIVLVSHWSPHALAPVRQTIKLVRGFDVELALIGSGPVFENSAFVPVAGFDLMFWDNQHMTIGAMNWCGAILRKHPAFPKYVR